MKWKKLADVELGGASNGTVLNEIPNDFIKEVQHSIVMLIKSISEVAKLERTADRRLVREWNDEI